MLVKSFRSNLRKMDKETVRQLDSCFTCQSLTPKNDSTKWMLDKTVTHRIFLLWISAILSHQPIRPSVHSKTYPPVCLLPCVEFRLRTAATQVKAGPTCVHWPSRSLLSSHLPLGDESLKPLEPTNSMVQVCSTSAASGKA